MAIARRGASFSQAGGITARKHAADVSVEVEIEWFDEVVYEEIQFQTKDGLQIGLEYSKRTIGRRVTRTQVEHSDPGEFWVSQTGEALRSIDYAVEVRDEDGEFVAGAIGSDLEYVRYLEVGTGRIEPRPTLRPAVLQNKEEIVKSVAEGG